MKNPRDDLSPALQGWHVRPPADPGFRPAVWARLRARPDGSWPAYLRHHAVSCGLAAVVAFSAAGYTGLTVAHARSTADREAIVVTYLVGLDPRVQAVLKP